MGMANCSFKWLSGTNFNFKRLALLGFILPVLFGFYSQANAQGFQVSHGRREFVASPDQNLSSTITIRNSSDKNGTYEVVFKDFVEPDGERAGYATDEIGKVKRSMRQWVNFSPRILDVGPGEERTVIYTVEVPDDLMLTGTYFGAFIVSAIADDKEIEDLIDGKDVEEPKIGISVEFEYAILAYVTIAGTQQPNATFSQIQITSTDTGTNTIATVDNTGNVLLRPDVWMEIKDKSGLMVYETTPFSLAVLPSSSTDFVFSLAPAKLTPGEYLVMVIADYGVPQMIAAQARINVTEQMVDEREAQEAAAAAEAERIAAEEAARVEAEGGDSEGGDSEEEAGGAGEGEPEAA